nr:MAG TPA: hypothetical protein [Caudoviricetes sp.]
MSFVPISYLCFTSHQIFPANTTRRFETCLPLSSPLSPDRSEVYTINTKQKGVR